MTIFCPINWHFHQRNNWSPENTVQTFLNILCSKRETRNTRDQILEWTNGIFRTNQSSYLVIGHMFHVAFFQQNTNCLSTTCTQNNITYTCKHKLDVWKIIFDTYIRKNYFIRTTYNTKMKTCLKNMAS